MQKPSDEMLVAYLDGEIGEAELAEVELCLERDQSVRDRVRELTLSGNLLRDAFDDLLDEPVPERLHAAATGRKALPADTNVVAFGPRMTLSSTRSWISLAAAASLFGMIFGGSVTYLAAGGKGPGTNGDGQVKQSQIASIDATTVNNSWLDNVAACHNLHAPPARGSARAGFD